MEKSKIYNLDSKKNPRKLSIWELKKIGKIVFSIFRWYIIICLIFVVLYPLLYMISVSFRTAPELVDPSVVWLPKHFTFDNIKETLKLLNYFVALKSSLFVAIVPTVIQIVACSLCGYGLARFKFLGKNTIFIIVLFSILVPLQTIAIPMYTQIRFFDFFGIGRLIGLFIGLPLTVNLYNTPLAIIVPAILGNGLRGAFYVYIFRQFFMGMPLDLEDAANIDGCGTFKTFTKIIFPLSLPPLLVTFILSIIWYWNDGFLVPYLYPKAQTLAMRIDGMAASLSLSYDTFQIFMFQQVGSLLMILPMLIIFLFLQKYFMESIDRTGLK